MGPKWQPLVRPEEHRYFLSSVHNSSTQRFKPALRYVRLQASTVVVQMPPTVLLCCPAETLLLLLYTGALLFHTQQHVQEYCTAMPAACSKVAAATGTIIYSLPKQKQRSPAVSTSVCLALPLSVCPFLHLSRLAYLCLASVSEVWLHT